MSVPQNVIAMIFDFDDTLTDDSTTKLLEYYTIDINKFWKENTSKRVKEGWDHSLAYLDLILDLVGDKKRLGNLSNKDLFNFGSKISFYKGIPELFNSLKESIKEFKISNPKIEFYIISGGIEQIILGSSISKYFDGIWGCTFEEIDGKISKIKNSVSFTEKTKYLYYINKGLTERARKNQFSVNKFVSLPDRRIPFKNMIYIGDGYTDVPCFSLIKHFGGKAFGVFDPKKIDSPKKAWEQLIAPRRVETMNSPCYGKEDDLGALLHVAVSEICARFETNSRIAL